MTSTNSTDNNLATTTMIGKLCELITTMQKNHDEQIAEMRQARDIQQKAHEEQISIMQKNHEVISTRLGDLKYTNQYIMELNKVKYSYAARQSGSHAGEIKSTFENIHRVSQNPAIDGCVNWSYQVHGTYIPLRPGVEYDPKKHGLKKGCEFVYDETPAQKGMYLYKRDSLNDRIAHLVKNGSSYFPQDKKRYPSDEYAVFNDCYEYDEHFRGNNEWDTTGVSWTDTPVYLNTGILPETSNSKWTKCITKQRRDVSEILNKKYQTHCDNEWNGLSQPWNK